MSCQTESGAFSASLIGLAFAGVVVAYPPPATGLDPLLGTGNMFLPLIASVASLLIAVVGGVFLTKNYIGAKSENSRGRLVRVLVTIVPAIVIGGYLVVVAGFAPHSSFIVGAIVLGIAVALSVEYTN